MGKYAKLDALGQVSTNCLPELGGGSLPSGIIVMWGGLLATIPSGWALCDGQNGTPDLRSRFIKGAAPSANPGATGGAASHTPAGTVSQPTFAGNALGTHQHGAGTLLPSAHSGAAVADHASHTHVYTQVPNHVHGFTDLRGLAQGGVTTNRAVTESADASSTATGLKTANPDGGVASAVTQGPNAALSHSVTQPAAHTMSGSSAAVSAGTPSGTVSQPTFTGTPASFEPQWYALAYIQKT